MNPLKHIGILCFALLCLAQSPTPEPILVNQKLTEKVEQVVKTALIIESEDDGKVYLPLRDKSFAVNTQFVFFRRRGTRLSMIAQGMVEGERTNPDTQKIELVVNLDKDAIVKYPEVGDLGVPLSDPLVSGLGERRESSNTPIVPQKEPRQQELPGYIQYGMGLMLGSLSSNANPQVGGGKNASGYRFINHHFEYFSGVAPLGFAFQSHGGNFPTRVYDGDTVSSSESVSVMHLYYRLKPFGKKQWWASPKLFLVSDQLTTDNTGSELMNTKISAFGVGGRLQYQWASDVWAPKDEDSIGLQFQSVHADVGFSPFLSAQDAGPSRGTSSSGSWLLDYRVSATGMAWLGFVPVVKRWIIQASYGSRLMSLNFQGPTQSESGNPQTVPTGIKTSESESDFRFWVGIRISDPIEALLFEPDASERKKK